MNDRRMFHEHLSPEERYSRDAEFYELVRMLEAFIHKAQYTPTEMREATILACIHYEVNNVRSFMRPKEALGALDRSRAHLDQLKALLELEAAQEGRDD